MIILLISAGYCDEKDQSLLFIVVSGHSMALT